MKDGKATFKQAVEGGGLHSNVTDMLLPMPTIESRLDIADITENRIESRLIEPISHYKSDVSKMANL